MLDDYKGDYTSLMNEYVEEEDMLCQSQFIDGGKSSGNNILIHYVTVFGVHKTYMLSISHASLGRGSVLRESANSN